MPAAAALTLLTSGATGCRQHGTHGSEGGRAHARGGGGRRGGAASTDVRGDCATVREHSEGAARYPYGYLTLPVSPLGPVLPPPGLGFASCCIMFCGTCSYYFRSSIARQELIPKLAALCMASWAANAARFAYTSHVVSERQANLAALAAPGCQVKTTSWVL